MKNIIKKISNKVTEGIAKGTAVLVKEEKGASDLIAIVVIIVILLVVALVFKNQLVSIVNALGDKVTDWISSN